MCFSAGASFAAGSLLLFIAYMSDREIRQQNQVSTQGAWKKMRSQYGPLTTIPFWFGVQQFSEGALWRELGGGSSYADTWTISFETYTFLFFAFIVWPTWIPFSLYRIEHDLKRKKIIGALLGCGLCISAVLVAALVRYGATAEIVGHHIAYDFPSFPPFLRSYWMVLVYMVPVIGTFFVSSNRLLQLLGGAVLLSAIIARVAWVYWFTSVWCFFAALLSCMVWFVVRSRVKLMR